ncbi:MAG TPA: helix-hairpin-helix domain-containing protein [Phycisphaerae bacterium]|nr:helix-hairpin-helix domain-containing protein [Phycisphaerae bacterium]
MTGPSDKRYGLLWARANLAVLAVACAALAGLLVWENARRPRRIGHGVPVDEARLDAGSERVNPNTATAGSLQRLPGIGPGKAEAIVAYRQAHGPAPFRSPEDLKAVWGIGPATVKQVAELMSFPGAGGGPTSRPGGQ